MPWLFYSLVALGAYLLGSIPFGHIVGMARGVDLHKEGSGNIGATNALRVLGKKWGYLVFAGDVFKGFLAVRLAAWTAGLYHQDWVIAGIIAAFCVMVGHVFPVWIGFKGGKGIATSAGIMLGLYNPLVFLFGLAIWLGLFFGTRYVSVASIGAAIALPTGAGILWSIGWCDYRLVIVAAAMCLLALWRHFPNMQRLLAGTEKKFEKKKS